MSKRKYTNEPTAYCAELTETPKDLKRRIKEVKSDIATLVELVDRGIIDYQSGQTAIGQRYMELHGMKDRLKRAKYAKRRR